MIYKKGSESILYWCYIVALSALFPIESLSSDFSKDIEFGFDFHSVIVYVSAQEISTHAKRVYEDSSHKAQILLWALPIAAQCLYICKYREIYDENQVSDLLIKAYPFLSESRRHLLELITPHALNEEVLGIIHDLSSHNYYLSFTSNIEPGSLFHMQEKFPHVFSCFKSYYIPHVDEQTQKRICKPDLDYFLEWARDAKKRNPELTTLVFIDDLKKNCQGALKANVVLQEENVGVQFEPIHFTSAAQLREDLKKYTISKVI